MQFFFPGIFKKLINLFLAALGLRCCVQVFSSCGERASHCGGFSCCGARALGVRDSVVVARGLSNCGSQAQQLWHMGSVALWHVASSRTKDQTHVPCIGNGIPNHCITREVPPALFFFLRISLAILGLLWFHINFRIICSSFVKNVMGNLMGIVLHL